MTMQEVLLAAVSGGIGALCGGVGAAYGATAAVKQILATHDKRLNRVEQRVGVTEEGTLTGNGILNEIHQQRRHNLVSDRRVTRVESHMQIHDRPVEEDE